MGARCWWDAGPSPRVQDPDLSQVPFAVQASAPRGLRAHPGQRQRLGRGHGRRSSAGTISTDPAPPRSPVSETALTRHSGSDAVRGATPTVGRDSGGGPLSGQLGSRQDRHAPRLSNRGALRPLQLTRAALVAELEAARSPASAGSWGTNAAYPRPSHLCGSLLAPTLPTASPKPPRTPSRPSAPRHAPHTSAGSPCANPPRHNPHNLEHPAMLPAAPSHPCGSRLPTTLPATPVERRVVPMLPAEPLHHCGLLRAPALPIATPTTLLDPSSPQPSALLTLYPCGPSLVSSQSSLSRPIVPHLRTSPLAAPSLSWEVKGRSGLGTLEAPRLGASLAWSWF